VKHTSYETPHYAVFFSLQQLPHLSLRSVTLMNFVEWKLSA